MLLLRPLPAAGLAGLALACGPAPDAPPAAGRGDEAREVRTALVERAEFERSVPAVGELAPFERTVIATKVPGRLAELLVDRGDAVTRGQVLARLEEREYALRVQAAEAALATARALLGLPAPNGDGEDAAVDPETTSPVRSARAELERAELARERARKLAGEGIDSQSVFDQAEADQRVAASRLQEAYELVAARRATLAQRQAELEIARAQLDETRLEAPFDGRVDARLAATGAYLAIGDPVFELVRLDPMRLVLEVAERDAGAVRAGQFVRARLDGAGGEVSGPIVRLAPALAEGSRALVVEVEVRGAELDGAGPALRSGAFAEARVVVAPSEWAASVPAEAITSFAGLDKAYVVGDGAVEERRVELGRRAAGRIEVRAGLSEGEHVVLAPAGLAAGARVRVVESADGPEGR